MILKVGDAIKSLSRTPACRNGSTGRPARLSHSGGDPDCEARRDLTGLYSPPLAVYGKSNIPLRYPAACRLRQSFSDGARRGDLFIIT